jgi:zinc transporter 5/7
VLTFIGAWPLLKESGEILLQRIPRSIEDDLSYKFTELLQIPGVLGYSKAHFWELNQGEHCGSIVVQVDGYVDDQLIQTAVQNLFRPLSINNLTVQVNKDMVRSY